MLRRWPSFGTHGGRALPRMCFSQYKTQHFRAPEMPTPDQTQPIAPHRIATARCALLARQTLHNPSYNTTISSPAPDCAPAWAPAASRSRKGVRAPARARDGRRFLETLPAACALHKHMTTDTPHPGPNNNGHKQAPYLIAICSNDCLLKKRSRQLLRRSILSCLRFDVVVVGELGDGRGNPITRTCATSCSPHAPHNSPRRAPKLSKRSKVVHMLPNRNSGSQVPVRNRQSMADLGTMLAELGQICPKAHLLIKVGRVEPIVGQ